MLCEVCTRNDRNVRHSLPNLYRLKMINNTYIYFSSLARIVPIVMK